MPLPQEFIDELHERNDIVDVIGSYVSLNHRGRLYTALCPFHNDHHASLSFKVSRNTFRCFVCGASGGPIDLVMRYLNKPFLEACRWLADESAHGDSPPVHFTLFSNF